jgi:hypothetical protein
MTSALSWAVRLEYPETPGASVFEFNAYFVRRVRNIKRVPESRVNARGASVLLVAGDGFEPPTFGL